MIDWDALLPVAPTAPSATREPGLQPIPAPDPAAPVTEQPAPPCRDGDNRRRCTDCGNLNERGLCLAAHRGEITASRSYTPIRDLPRRCEGYRPLPDDHDQRSAWDRWGTISSDETTYVPTIAAGTTGG